MTEFLARLQQTLGEDVVLTQPEDIAPWLTDWRGLYRGQAQAVVLPRTTQQVSQCLALCHEYGQPVVPRGGNTGLCGAATPDGGSDNVVLALARLNSVRDIDTVGNTMTVEAGCILETLQGLADAQERLLPLSLAAQGSCEIGGNLSTNAGGVNVLRYGMARELVLGLEVVLPDGTIVDELHPLRKDNTGYDIKQLFIGAEGTLGVITAATLRLQPKLHSRSVALFAVGDVRHALSAFEVLYAKCGSYIQAYEYISDACMQLVTTYLQDLRSPFAHAHAGYVLVELGDVTVSPRLQDLLESSIEILFERELSEDAVVATSLAQLKTLWRLREDISEAQQADGPNLKHDVSVPIRMLPDFMQRVEALLAEQFPGVRFYASGHFGDGNIHCNVSRPLGAPLDYFVTDDRGHAITSALLAVVHEFKGSISAEHGVGQLKRDHFLQYKSPSSLALMRKIKAAIDPQGIMNPGKVL